MCIFKGLPTFLVLTDHRPLEGLFLKDLFDLPSPRLQRMCEKVAMYNFNVNWTPGKTHLIAEALSCAPLFDAKDLPGLEIDTAITCLSATSSASLDIIYSAIDEDYRLLISDVANGTQYSVYSSSLKSDINSLSLHPMVWSSWTVVVSCFPWALSSPSSTFYTIVIRE